MCIYHIVHVPPHVFSLCPAGVGRTMCHTCTAAHISRGATKSIESVLGSPPRPHLLDLMTFFPRMIVHEIIENVSFLAREVDDD